MIVSKRGFFIRYITIILMIDFYYTNYIHMQVQILLMTILFQRTVMQWQVFHMSGKEDLI